jgi:hypothetical protein
VREHPFESASVQRPFLKSRGLLVLQVEKWLRCAPFPLCYTDDGGVGSRCPPRTPSRCVHRRRRFFYMVREWQPPPRHRRAPIDKVSAAATAACTPTASPLAATLCHPKRKKTSRPAFRHAISLISQQHKTG